MSFEEIIEQNQRDIARAYGVPPEIVGIPVTHIAGLVLEIGVYIRQRCAWCGAELINVDVTRVAIQTPEDGSEPTIATWPVGAQIRVDGAASYVVEGNQLPEDSCTG